MTRLYTHRQFHVILVLLVLLALVPGRSLAATCNSIDPGSWGFTGNWSCGQVPDSGDDVTISHAISMNGSDRAARNFTIASGGSLNDTGNILTVTGTVTINGTWNGAGGGRLTKNSTGNLSGTGTVTGDARIDINGNTTIPSTANLTFTDTANGRIDVGSGVTVTNNGTVTLAQLTEDDATSTWINAAGSTLSVRVDIFPVNGVLNASATGNTVNYSGTVTQNVIAVTYHHLTLSGSGTKNIGTAGSQTININGNLTVGSGTTYKGNAVSPNPAVNLKGNFINNGTFTSGGGIFKFNGSTAQTITGAVASTTIASLTLSNAAGLTLTGTHNVTAASVDITSGRIKTGSNVLIISGGAVILSGGLAIPLGASTFVVGNLQKRVASGSNISRTFEVGTEPGGVPRYARVVVNLGSVGTAGNLQVSTTDGDHPQIGSSTLDATKSVNRYWTLATVSPLAFTASGSNSITFTYVNPGDFNGESVTTSSLLVSRYSPALPTLPPTSSWTEITTSNSSPTATISGSGITSANISGDYQLANKLPTAPPTPGSFDAFETSQLDTDSPKVIRTKVASGTTGFTLSIMAISGGVKQTTFTGTGANVKLELIGVNTLGTLTSGNCPTSGATVLQTIGSFAISNGRSDATFAAVPNSWRDVRVRISYPTTSPTVTVCSSDNFAIRPASFTAAVTDTDWSTAGTARTLDNTVASGGRVHKAGQPFTITLTPSPATTTNYIDRTVAVGALTCVLAGTCTTSMLNVGTFTGSGTQVSTTATFSEAGAFNLSLQDQDYASVDSGDTAGDCTASGRYVCDSGAPRGVGRFVPDHFVVTSVTAPIFRTFDTTNASCTTPPSGPLRPFTYIGQYFGYQTPPSAMIVAQNAGNQTTANYRGTLWKLTNASATQQFDNSPAKTLDITQIGSPVVAETPGTGTGTLTPAAAGKLAFQRDNSTPEGEFTANLSLTLSVSDSSEAGTGETTITPIATATPQPLFSNIAFDGDGAASGKTFRYGRLQIGAARGELSAPLAVPMETQYAVNITTFTTNTADHCTTLDAANIGLGNFAGNLAAGETTVLALSLVGAFSAGKKSLTLTAPGAGNNGSVDIVANLGATTPDSCTTFKPLVTGTTGANKSWLRERGTCSTTYTKDPTGRATFGVRLGSEEVIHFRENF